MGFLEPPARHRRRADERTLMHGSAVAGGAHCVPAAAAVRAGDAGAAPSTVQPSTV
jgi:hypothetical protein